MQFKSTAECVASLRFDPIGIGTTYAMLFSISKLLIFIITLSTSFGLSSVNCKASSILRNPPLMAEAFVSAVKERKQLKWTSFINPYIVLGTLPLLVLPSISFATTSGLVNKLNHSGFIQSSLLIFVSEIGDKTFFIACLLAARYGKLISFAGSVGALVVMTVLSTILGQLFHAVPSSLTQGIPYDDYIAVAAFTYFGVKTLLDANKMGVGDDSVINEEKAEAEEALKSLDSIPTSGGTQTTMKSTVASNKVKEAHPSTAALILQTFSLVFAAEIGDRSFISTVALSAALNPYAVAAGAIAAHAVATAIAVLGGGFLSKYLSEKVIGYIGGCLFLVFAVSTAIGLF